jgi:hypothetical protein
MLARDCPTRHKCPLPSHCSGRQSQWASAFRVVLTLGPCRSTLLEEQSKRLADAVEKKVAAEAQMLELMETLARDSDGLGILMVAVCSAMRDKAREYAENAASKKSQDVAMS